MLIYSIAVLLAGASGYLYWYSERPAAAKGEAVFLGVACFPFWLGLAKITVDFFRLIG